MHDNGLVRAKPLSHEDGCGRRRVVSGDEVPAMDQVLIHVLAEVDEQCHFLLLFGWCSLCRECYYLVAEVIVRQCSELKQVNIYYLVCRTQRDES